MLRLTLEVVPYGIEGLKKTIGRLKLANDGTASEGFGNYDAELELCAEEAAKKGRLPLRTRIYDFKRQPDVQGRAWDLCYIALRDLLARRNPWRPHRENEAIYIKDGDTYVPVKEFAGFPATGVHLVYKDKDEPGLHASFRWIGDIPEQDALTYAAAQVHHDAACQALSEYMSRSLKTSVQRLDEAAHGKDAYQWQEPTIYSIVQCVLNAIAASEAEASHE